MTCIRFTKPANGQALSRAAFKHSPGFQAQRVALAPLQLQISRCFSAQGEQASWLISIVLTSAPRSRGGHQQAASFLSMFRATASRLHLRLPVRQAIDWNSVPRTGRGSNQDTYAFQRINCRNTEADDRILSARRSAPCATAHEQIVGLLVCFGRPSCRSSLTLGSLSKTKYSKQ